LEDGRGEDGGEGVFDALVCRGASDGKDAPV